MYRHIKLTSNLWKVGPGPSLQKQYSETEASNYNAVRIVLHVLALQSRWRFSDLPIYIDGLISFANILESINNDRFNTSTLRKGIMHGYRTH